MAAAVAVANNSLYAARSNVVALPAAVEVAAHVSSEAVTTSQ